MNSTVLSVRSCSLRTRLIASPRFYPSFQISRPASLNSAIARGLRRSKGVGFRSRERGNDVATNSDRGASQGVIRRSADPVVRISEPRLTREAWRASRKDKTGPDVRIRRGKKDVTENEKPKRRSRAARFYDPDSSFGKRSLQKRSEKEQPVVESSTSRGGERSIGRRRPEIDRSVSTGRRRPESSEFRKYNSVREDEGEQRNLRRKKPSPSRTAYLERTSVLSTTYDNYRENVPEQKGARESKSGAGRAPYPEKTSARSESANDENSTPKFTITKSRSDNRVPLSIPYTTPASEFLYGTSVVEAALRSQRYPKRKLYKFYVYTGENRQGEIRDIRDAGLEKLAKRNGVEIVHLGNDGVRLLDKMSGGRPHNGYILEASPLPRLPITSLGEVMYKDGQSSFKVDLDHQSREEAAINGTSDLIRFRQFRDRQPFVLLLDGIIDPGNLGGIIRTASFLGVTAVAISTHQSASFTPVVLKASAGASENMTLFSVSKPAGFVAGSKLAGWKIYAAVAPPRRGEFGTAPHIPAHELDEPLQEEPCILMLGNEGEGLKKNVRVHADVDISIHGNGYSHGVDSLNVSVAAGILCNAFLSRGQRALQKDRVEKILETKSDLF